MKITNALKKRSKEIFNLSVYVIAGILVTSPLAFAAPLQLNQRVVNTNFKTFSNSAFGCSSNGASRSCFAAAVYDDLFTGEPQFSIQLESFYPDPDGYYHLTGYIFCSFSGSANIVSVDPGKGSTSVKATLNLPDPDHSCDIYNWPAGTVMVNLSGSYRDGDYRASSSGKVQQHYNGTTFRSNSRSDSFDETFVGSITGFNGPWRGSAGASRHTEREQVK